MDDFHGFTPGDLGPDEETLMDMQNDIIVQQNSVGNRAAATTAYDVMSDIKEHLLSSGRDDAELVNKAAEVTVLTNIFSQSVLGGVMAWFSIASGGTRGGDSDD